MVSNVSDLQYHVLVNEKQKEHTDVRVGLFDQLRNKMKPARQMRVSKKT